MRLPNVIQNGDDWYEVVRSLKDNPKYDAGILREYWNCSHTFRKNGMLYFCREIPKINYIEL